MPEGQPNIVVFWGDDIGITQPELLQRRPDGLSHAEHRPPGGRGHALHRLLRRAELHRRPRRRSSRARASTARGSARSACPGADLGLQARGPHHRRAAAGRSATRPGSSARTTSATATSSCPRQHGFDEFFGNLYHLNAEEEPELADYPRRRRLPELPRALRAARRAALPARRPTARRRIEDTGPLTKKRMETIDDEIVDGAVDFIDRRHADGRARSSCGSTRPTCTSARTPSPRAAGRPAGGSRPTTTR